MSAWSWKAGLAGVAIVAATAYAVAQMGPGPQGMPGPMGQMSPHGGMGGAMQDHHQMMQGRQRMHGAMAHHAMMSQQMMMTGQPTMPGQDAFGTIQEVVQILEADPATDWSKVNIGALREYLIDMSEVTLRADATERALDDGVEITVTGEGRTLQAIKRMVPAHARELGRIGWNAKADDLPKGVKLTVTSTDPNQTIKLKALGFMGIMVQGAHHQPHHLAMARGEFDMH
jgi:hypothetical protein